MPDEIGWPTPEDEVLLDAARREAAREAPSTAEDDAELERIAPRRNVIGSSWSDYARSIDS